MQPCLAWYSLCSPDWPQSHNNPPVPATQRAVIMTCTTLLSLPFFFLQWQRISPQLLGEGACLSWVQTFLDAHECWWLSQQPSEKSVLTQKPSTRLQFSSVANPTLISFPSTVNDFYVTSHLCTSGVSVSIQVHRSLMTPRQS